MAQDEHIEAAPVRVLIADDHRVVRQGLRVFLGLDREIEVVGEAEHGREAIQLARVLRPDVVLMDLLMPVMDGLAATEAIRRELPEVAVVALTGILGDDTVMAAVRAGAAGFLLKDASPDELRRAVKAAAIGQAQVSPAALARLMGQVKGPAGSSELTGRETGVLVMLARGQANKEIARALRIGEETVKTHVSSILRKLGMHSRTEAAVYAMQKGLVDPDAHRK